jgi:hypothetical protein
MIEIITAIIAIVVFIFSAWLNVFLIRRLLFFSENVDMLTETIVDFEQHLEKVNSMETYYGDETLAQLLEHSSTVVDEMQEFKNIYGESKLDDKKNTKKAQT